MTTFAHHFREHAMPRLRDEAQRQAKLLALDLAEWEDASHAVMQLARKHGAMHLPDDKFYELGDWISSTLLMELDKAEADTAERVSHLATLETADPVAYYTALPKTLTGVFEAISPAYRAHLKVARSVSR